MVAEKTAKNFRGLLYFAAPCSTEIMSSIITLSLLTLYLELYLVA